MDNAYTIVDFSSFMTRLVFVLLGLRLLVWWGQFDGEKPAWLPFKIFRWICSRGEKLPIEKFTKICEFTKFRYLDTRYQEWKEECVNANKLTHLEYLAFEYQTLIEIEYVLKVKSENSLDA